MLTKNGAPPNGDFEKLKYLEPAKDHKSRHKSILLPFDATIQAFLTANK